MTSDAERLLANIAKDVEARELTDEELSAVSALAARQIKIEDDIAKCNSILATATKELDRIRTQLLPAALTACGLTEIHLTDGSAVIIAKIIRASIPKAKQTEAFEWLVDNDHGDLIKHIVSARFDREQDEEARAVFALLENMGLDPEDKKSVHANTLSAFVREQTRDGNDVPDDLLGVYRGDVAKVERPKAARF